MLFAISRTAASTALAISCALSLSCPASAEASSPIRITKCDIVREEVPRHGVAQETVRISFSIDGSVAADEAHFVASVGSNRFKGFIARGLFSGGVVIADRLLAASPQVTEFEALRGNLGCVPSYVHFVDGSSWSASSEH